MKKIFVFIVAAVLTLQTVQATEGFLERDDLRKIGHDTSKFVLEKPLQKKEDIISKERIVASAIVAAIFAGMSIYFFDGIKKAQPFNNIYYNPTSRIITIKSSDAKLTAQICLFVCASFFILSCSRVYKEINTRTKQLKKYKKQKKILKESRFRNAR